MFYGYSVRQVNQYGLLELREVSLDAPAEALREIARFLHEMADLMDAGGFVRCSHRHLSIEHRDWGRKFPGYDIVVLAPTSAQPLPNEDEEQSS